MNIRLTSAALAVLWFAAAAILFALGNSALAQELMPTNEVLIRVDSKTHNSITITARGMQPDLTHPNDPNNPQALGYIREKPSGACPDPLVNGFFDRTAAGREGYQLFTRLANSRRINEITNWKIPGDPPDAGTISTPLMPNTEYCILVAAFSGGQSGRRHLIITETTDEDHSPTAMIAAVSGTRAADTQVTLDGSGSTANTGDTTLGDDSGVTTYQWTQVENTGNPAALTTEANRATLTGATTAMASFTAPRFATETMLHFSLVVTDSDGPSDPAYVSVTVSAALAPTAVITEVTGTPPADSQVTLNGSDSTANFGDTTLGDDDDVTAAYQWTQVDGPSSTTALASTHANYVQLTGATTPMASFTVPRRFTTNTMLHFSLTVTDGDGMDTDTITVTVTGANDPPATPVITVMHTPPTADATAIPLDVDAARIAPSIPAMGDTAAMNSQVVMSVTATDPDTGDAITSFAWMQVTTAGGSTAVPTSDPTYVTRTAASGEGIITGAVQSFDVPALVNAMGSPAGAGLVDGAPRTTPLRLHFSVVANDGTANSPAAYLTITVAAPSGDDSEVVDRAILPHVLRHIERSVHNSIFQRIQQRQRQDGRWK